MIRRVALLVTGTIASVAAVLSYNPPQLSAVANTTDLAQIKLKATPQAKATASSAPTAQKIKATPQAKATASSAPTAQKIKATPEASATASSIAVVPTISGTFVGKTSQTRWGPVEVQIKVVDGVITSVSALQYPNGDRRSLSISQQAIPYLIEETIAAQSTKISGVTGASYTTNGWISSLASAITKAGL